MKVYLFDEHGEGLREENWTHIPRVDEAVVIELSPDPLSGGRYRLGYDWTRGNPANSVATVRAVRMISP